MNRKLQLIRNMIYATMEILYCRDCYVLTMNLVINMKHLNYGN
jgi:hypothetical protein